MYELLQVKDGLGDITSEEIQGYFGVSEDESFRSSLIKSYNDSGMHFVYMKSSLLILGICVC